MKNEEIQILENAVTDLEKTLVEMEERIYDLEDLLNQTLEETAIYDSHLGDDIKRLLSKRTNSK